jgi:hypothetical protein
MQVLYVFHDAGVPNACKIGLNRDSGAYAWPYRFMQARAHTPREIHVAAAWDLSSAPALIDAERRAKAHLKSHRRTACHGSEWFDTPADEMVRQLAELLKLGKPFLRDRDPEVGLVNGLPYDDWRERSDLYKGEVWRRYLWVHGEDGPVRRYKVIHSPLYDIAYKYAFTYNPYPVYLVAAYQHPVRTDGPSPSLSPGNRAVQAVWEQIVSDKSFAIAPDLPQVGWLNETAILADIDRFARSRGLVHHDLRSPKPTCARPRDSQGGSPIAHGRIPSLRRVADWK